MIDWNRSLMAKAQEESLRFINRRLEHNTKTLESLRESKGLSEVIAAEQDWLASAARLCRGHAEIQRHASRTSGKRRA